MYSRQAVAVIVVRGQVQRSGDYQHAWPFYWMIRYWLINGTPAFHEPYIRITEIAHGAELSGIFLTLANTCHYTELVHPVYLPMATRELSVFVPPQMGRFLAANAPWKTLLKRGNTV